MDPGFLTNPGIHLSPVRGFPHIAPGAPVQNRAMIPTSQTSCTLTLLKRRDGAAPQPRWEIRCEDEPLGDFASLNEALATARTMAAHWLGEAQTVRLTGGDPSALLIDESYSRCSSK